eukprot:CAMPEP_0201867560 /NCGR_PEP_ID=MMETSP0902-20130614/1746_1 /ASSEMBLY_ACC=CAM_ASM_000551 /TAXON_ID=420261 /ORGANISM="Thalassiosira antarctica, Strain CCMP982" /LENGTH=209 /DNA_ID=CAMNT_0048392735 /DNA_START=33 /DNA_END=662 /DNA_ORIENTATION=+
MISSSLKAIAAIALIAASIPLASAFAGPILNGHTTQSRLSTILHVTPTPNESTDSSRRTFLSTIAATSLSAAILPLQPAFAAASPKDSLIADLNDSLSKITAIPSLVESAEWDKVRTVLKTPPVNQLWNLGESQNTLVKLAKETGDFEIMEMKDELAISLQMTDQYSYDNNFIYYQPGNGKIKTKEPLQMANKAISQLKEVLDAVNSSS